MASMIILSFTYPPIPGWLLVLMVVGGVVAFLIDRLRDRG
jgi:hypothetical protein